MSRSAITVGWPAELRQALTRARRAVALAADTAIGTSDELHAQDVAVALAAACDRLLDHLEHLAAAEPVLAHLLRVDHMASMLADTVVLAELSEEDAAVEDQR